MAACSVGQAQQCTNEHKRNKWIRNNSLSRFHHGESSTPSTPSRLTTSSIVAPADNGWGDRCLQLDNVKVEPYPPWQTHPIASASTHSPRIWQSEAQFSPPRPQASGPSVAGAGPSSGRRDMPRRCWNNVSASPRVSTPQACSIVRTMREASFAREYSCKPVSPTRACEHAGSAMRQQQTRSSSGRDSHLSGLSKLYV